MSANENKEWFKPTLVKPEIAKGYRSFSYSGTNKGKNFSRVSEGAKKRASRRYTRLRNGSRIMV